MGGEIQIGGLLLLPIMLILFLVGVAVMVGTVTALVRGGEYRLYVSDTHVGYSLPDWATLRRRGNFELAHNEVAHVLKRIRKRETKKDKIKYSIVSKEGAIHPIRFLSRANIKKFAEHCEEDLGINVLEKTIVPKSLDGAGADAVTAD